MAHLVATLGKRICVEESRDPSKRNNGGEYDFYETPVIIDGKEVGKLKSTSAEFDYCEISGWFTSTVYAECEGIEVSEEPLYINCDPYNAIWDSHTESYWIPEDRFLKLIK